MALSTGTKLGGYEVVALLGAGGMGEVYRAKDLKLGREVAVKILPEAFATDPERVARFKREAQVLASLNHPHIAALYGMEEIDGRHFLIMELVEGETLGERLRRGPVQVDEALKVAHQIVDALEAAHEKTVVHRDLKPANVKITPEENVKVLDFGLAKAMEPDRIDPNLTNSPTLSLMATQAGMILGTAAYMSPEQAKGFPADARSDVFSFGSVLYEMLTGRQPFQGETAPDILASVLVREADLSVLPANLNPRLHDLVKRCLEKSPKRRWQAVGDLKAEIEAIKAAPHAGPATTEVIFERPPLWRRAVLIAAAAVVASGITAAVASYVRPAPAPLTVTKFPLTLPEGQQFTTVTRRSLAISPDGSQLAYVANNRLYLRSMSELEARPIPGTDLGSNVVDPVFSPDGRSIAFYTTSDQTLKRIAVTGGAAVTICQASVTFGLSWGADGILFAQGAQGIMRVSANGGTAETLVAVKQDEVAESPQMLPDGQTVLFTVATGVAVDRWEKAQIVAQSLTSGQRKTLVTGGADGRYLSTGHLVYALGGILFGIPLDIGRLEVQAGPVPVVEGVRRAVAPTNVAQFAVSSSGSLVYLPGPASATANRSDLAFFDRQGGVQPLKLPPGSYENTRVSPDGKQVVFGTDDGKDATVWVYDLSGKTAMRRLTLTGRNKYPMWWGDGKRVVFQSDREGDLGIFWQLADGSAPAERLTKAEQGTSHTPESWSPSADVLLFSVTNGADISLSTFSLKDRKAASFGSVQSRFPTGATFSPDGQWVAYSESTGTGPALLHVQPFPPSGAKYRIAGTASIQSIWSPDGKGLLYNSGPGRYSFVSISTEPTFAVGNPVDVPRKFFEGPPGSARNNDMMRDGRIIGVLAGGQVPSGVPDAPTIQVVLNWFEEVKARAPAGN